MPVFKILYPFGHNKVSILIGDVSIGGAILVIVFKPLGACVVIVGYLELLFDSILELLDATGHFVLLSKPIHVPLAEGGNKSTNNSTEHVGDKFCIVSDGCLDGSREEGCRWHLSHNGSELFSGNGEGWHGRTGRPFFWGFEGHGRHRHLLVVAGVIVVWAVRVAAEVPVLNGVIVVSFDR